MVEKSKLFQSKIKYDGVFSFTDFYKFCYEWLRDETGLLLSEDKYAEKIKGDAKEIDVLWTGIRKLTDYFAIEVSAKFRILGLTSVEISQGNKKVKTNKGSVELEVKGTLLRDYAGKFEKNDLRKFLRGIYEKTIIPANVDQFETRVVEECSEFLAQAKAYLDIEGKK